ncbi:UNVERIFIED_CONTAM: hypothetical protein GTU68_039784 [Idotea baltica]|nr:hypothetical protein [Idotea baltica]
MFTVIGFYKFNSITEKQLLSAKLALELCAKDNFISGLVIVATEGINGTVCGSDKALALFKEVLIEHFGESNWPWKESQAESNAFKRFKVKIREEIVTTGLDNPVRVIEQGDALSPKQWHEMLNSQRDDVVIIDTRNHYETELGVFEGAVDPGLVNFQEFGEYIAKSDIPKDKTVLMYCTGGIRCEKAIYQMRELGYPTVFQLQGGILNYLKEFPDGKFDGECFVFDQRVAVTRELEPSSRWALCPHCGQPGDVELNCVRCSKRAKVCKRCVDEAKMNTCSKDCCNQLERLNARTKKQSMENSSAPE